MKKKPRIVKRILSVALAAALVTTSVQIAAIPSHVVLAAPGNIETGVPLGDTNVKDQNVLTFYKIIANAVFCAGNKRKRNRFLSILECIQQKMFLLDTKIMLFIRER